MKNILLILPYGGVGGMERLALNFYSCYKDKGYNVKALKFFGLESDIINFNEDELILSNKDLYAFNKLERIKFYLLTPIKIRRIIKTHNITHSISFGDLTNIFSALTYTNEKKIGSIHALKSVELSNNSIFSKLTRLSYKTSYRKFDKMVSISHAIKKDLIENCGYKFESNLKVIYNPHDTKTILELGQRQIEDNEEKLIFNKNVIVFLGRMSVQKSPWHLINAFSLLKEKKDVNLVFIGDGDKQVINIISKMIKHYSIEDSVYFMGRKSNPYKYLSKAKTLVLTSHYEGTPNVIIEAIALNIPVVSSNCTNGIAELMSLNHSEVISSNQNIEVESGIITPNVYKGIIGIPENTLNISEEERKVADALFEVINNENHKISVSKNSKKLTKKFDVDYVCDSYLE
ncbi:glycosyltransferase [Flavivirga aquimarina]|uniref:Glycosyltransferase n=1 Tax=Flavivirga aquimarina TaxID=2027862 RepID=A0ABT8WD90_9FLAO|nr:glycosyltransferase [Flavivirga aquimarina]MDO5971128.1 glycosyltransferase [Flavivirga aquimarina]